MPKTWKQIKEEIEAEGVKDEDQIAYIDIDGYMIIICTKEDNGGWCISD